MLTTIHRSFRKVEYIGFEICFKKEYQLIISIYPQSHIRLKSHEPGSLEFSHEFSQSVQLNHNISLLIDWIIDQGDFKQTIGRAGDIGKEIYHLIKNIGH